LEAGIAAVGRWRWLPSPAAAQPLYGEQSGEADARDHRAVDIVQIEARR
jgi:hypothetical protein